MTPRRITQVLSLCTLLVAALLLPAMSVRAQGPELEAGHTDEPAGYRETIDEAVHEFALQNYAEARSLFHRAHVLYPNARTQRGMGMAEFELRRYAECIQQLEASLASRVKPLTGGLRGDTERLLARAQKFVARIQLHTRPATARVLIDGAALELQGAQPVLVPVGDHLIEVQAQGFVSERRKLTVQGGESKSLTVILSADSAPPAARPKQQQSWYKSPWLWAGLGVVVAGTAAGAGYALTREDKTEPSYGGSARAVLRGP